MVNSYDMAGFIIVVIVLVLMSVSTMYDFLCN